MSNDIEVISASQDTEVSIVVLYFCLIFHYLLFYQSNMRNLIKIFLYINIQISDDEDEEDDDELIDPGNESANILRKLYINNIYKLRENLGIISKRMLLNMISL